MASTKSRTLLAAATAALVALPTAAFGLESFTPGEDPCLGDPAEAPYVDRDEVREPHLKAVDCTFENGVMVGSPTGPLSPVTGEREFNPGASVSRAQMATILVNSLEAAGYTLPADAPDAFTDDDGSVHEDNINKLAATGIVNGTSETEYSPGRAIKRDQMASLLVQAAEAAYGTDFNAPKSTLFPDVSANNVHVRNITVASEWLGLIVGDGQGQFNPNAETRRDWMATFSSRLVDMVLIDADDPASDPQSGPTVGQDGNRDISG
jgi:hypothetical protein